MNREKIIEILIDNDIDFDSLLNISFIDSEYFSHIMKTGFKGYNNYTYEELIDECNERGISVLEIN